MDRLIIFDTTLRDGEQCPGASMDIAQKIEVANMLASLNVDIIEAGFAIASPGDFEAINQIAKTVKGPVICSLARAAEQDLDKAYEALKPAERFRIHTFIATSKIHMEKKLNLTPGQVIERAVMAVKRARNYTDDVEFSAEDAGRSDLDFLCKIFEEVINAGAKTINIPDTVGYTLPDEFGALVKNVITRVPNSDKAIFSTHCHNDLGLAVANSLAGVANGARQVECTINGIGERAGNAAMEEIVMTLKTRPSKFACTTNINTKNLVPASKLVSKVTGFIVQKNKAIVGQNAFAHEAGIHQDGIIKSRETYEIMRAEDVGWDSNSLVLGKHSGHNAFKQRLAFLKVNLSGDLINKAFDAFKLLADREKVVDDKMLLELIDKIKKEG